MRRRHSGGLGTQEPIRAVRRENLRRAQELSKIRNKERRKLVAPSLFAAFYSESPVCVEIHQERELLHSPSSSANVSLCRRTCRNHGVLPEGNLGPPQEIRSEARKIQLLQLLSHHRERTDDTQFPKPEKQESPQSSWT